MLPGAWHLIKAAPLLRLQLALVLRSGQDVAISISPEGDRPPISFGSAFFRLAGSSFQTMYVKVLLSVPQQKISWASTAASYFSDDDYHKSF